MSGYGKYGGRKVEEDEVVTFGMVGVARRRVAIVLVLDVSGSMEGRAFRSMCDGVDNLLRHLDPADLVLGVCFNNETTNLTDARFERVGSSSLSANLRKQKPSGRTKLYDSVLGAASVAFQFAALQSIVGSPAGLPKFHVVVLTDGEDNASSKSAKDVSTALRKLGSAVDLQTTFIGVGLDASAQKQLATIASDGGSHVTCRNVTDSGIAQVFTELTTTLRVVRVVARAPRASDLFEASINGDVGAVRVALAALSKRQLNDLRWDGHCFVSLLAVPPPPPRRARGGGCQGGCRCCLSARRVQYSTVQYCTVLLRACGCLVAAWRNPGLTICSPCVATLCRPVARRCTWLHAAAIRSVCSCSLMLAPRLTPWERYVTRGCGWSPGVEWRRCMTSPSGPNFVARGVCSTATLPSMAPPTRAISRLLKP